MAIKTWLKGQIDLYKKTNQIPFILAIWLPYHLLAIILILQLKMAGGIVIWVGNLKLSKIV